MEGGEAQTLFEALRDADSRAILDETGSEALSAKEISEACDLPLSSTYRKLDTLTEAGLLEERTRIRQSGKHPSEYIRAVEEVVVSIDDEMNTVTRTTASNR
jgi:DNA-binding transcriptional ArsR family regulator